MLFLFLLLGTTAIYSALVASNGLANNSDAVVYPYLVGEHPLLHEAVFPAKHANLIKLPLFYLQAWLPYHYTTFALSNVALMLVTVLALAGAIVWPVRGRRIAVYAVILALTTLLAISPELSNQLAYTTVRNIEYPIALLFMISAARIATKRREFRSVEYYLYVLIFLLYAAVLASDDFFEYTTSVSIILILVLLSIKQRRLSKPVVIATGYVVLASLGGALLQKLAISVGLYIPDKGYLSGLSFVSPGVLLPAIKATTGQLASLLGLHFHATSLGIFDIPALLWCLIILVGFLGFAYNLIYWFHAQPPQAREVSFSMLVLCFFITVAAYIAAGFAVTKSGGQYVASDNERYLTFLPFILISGLGYFITKLKVFHANHSYLLLLIFPILVGFATPSLLNKLRSERNSATATRASMLSVSDALKANDINEVLTGYWYGASLRFWSHDSIDYAVVAECDKPSVLNSRLDWYMPNSHIKKSAIIIDTSGPDIPYFGYCTEQQLYEVYGKPAYIVQARSVTIQNGRDYSSPTKPLNIWVYNYDLRARLQPAHAN